MEIPPCLQTPIQGCPALLQQIYFLPPCQCLPYFMFLPWSQLASQACAVPFSSRSNNSGWAAFHLLLTFGERSYEALVAQDRLYSTSTRKSRGKEWQRDHHQNLVSGMKSWTQDAFNLPILSGKAIFSHLDSPVYSLIFLKCESSRYGLKNEVI